MDEVAWLSSRIGVNDELLWAARQTSRQLAECKATLELEWDNAGLRQLRDRFLTPHEEDNAACLTRFTEQIQSLTSVLDDLQKLHTSAAAADRISRQIEVLLNGVRAEFARVSDGVERAADAIARSSSASTEAESLINQADACGH